MGEETKRFLVYYGDTTPIEVLDPYDLLVFDSHAHIPLHTLADRGKTLLGYLSLGEVASNRPYFARVQADNILLDENPNWPGSYHVDVRSPHWSARVIEELIPDILRRGFHGLFLDTLDNPPHLERTDPRRYQGMTEAAARLVRTIRKHYPLIYIMVNRGYEILPVVAPQIQGILGESIRSRFDFASKLYQWVDEDEYRQQVTILQNMRKKHPHLTLFSLDYRDPQDSQGMMRCYKEQRANGFIPYVATPDLERIVLEPVE
ncbi:MAG: endo alpha-1,4 polygalactosaminidase [Magnetococcales bacterium]|nr:endo alpha-1,4 polygalactosaminidase [Magnetococcales bacterium]